MFVNNDNNKILKLLKKLFNIYDRNLRKKKLDSFFKFYYNSVKQKVNEIEYNNNLIKKLNKRKKKIELFNKNSEDFINNRNKYIDKNLQKNIMKKSTPITLRSFDEAYYKNNFNHHIKNPNLIFDDDSKQLLRQKNKKQINKNSKKFPINNQIYNNKYHFNPYSNLPSYELPIYLRSDIERIKKEGNFNKYKDNIIQRPLSYNKNNISRTNKLNISNLRNSYESYPKKTSKLNGISESLCLLFSSRLHKDNNNLYNNNYNSNIGNLNDMKNIKKKNRKKNEVSSSTFYDKGTNYISEKQSHEIFNNTQNLENTHQNINYSSSNSIRNNNNNLDKQKDQFYTFRTGKIQYKNNNSVINPQKIINQQVNSTKSTHFISPRYDGQLTDKINNNINKSNKSNLFESADDQTKIIIDTQNSKGKNTIILDNSGGINNSGLNSNKSYGENINNKKNMLFVDEKNNINSKNQDSKDTNEELVRSGSIQSFPDAILLDMADRHLGNDYDLERYQYLNKNKVQKHFYMDKKENDNK
jgi:hypothetical protein